MRSSDHCSIKLRGTVETAVSQKALPTLSDGYHSAASLLLFQIDPCTGMLWPLCSGSCLLPKDSAGSWFPRMSLCTYKFETEVVILWNAKFYSWEGSFFQTPDPPMVWSIESSIKPNIVNTNWQWLYLGPSAYKASTLLPQISLSLFIFCLRKMDFFFTSEKCWQCGGNNRKEQNGQVSVARNNMSRFLKGSELCFSWKKQMESNGGFLMKRRFWKSIWLQQ